jgi:chromosomal replication initiation ATPase DnaA
VSAVDEDALETAFVFAYERTRDIKAANRVVIRVNDLLRAGGELAQAKAALAVRMAERTPRVAAELVALVAAVAGEHGLTAKDLTGPSRVAAVVLARDEAAWRLRRDGHSFSVVGAALGRSHQVALQACRRHETRIAAKSIPSGSGAPGYAPRSHQDTEAARGGEAAGLRPSGRKAAA